MDVLYLCDKKKCAKCVYPDCMYTSDIAHAKNFTKSGDFYAEDMVRAIPLRESTGGVKQYDNHS